MNSPKKPTSSRVHWSHARQPRIRSYARIERSTSSAIAATPRAKTTPRASRSNHRPNAYSSAFTAEMLSERSSQHQAHAEQAYIRFVAAWLSGRTFIRLRKPALNLSDVVRTGALRPLVVAAVLSLFFRLPLSQSDTRATTVFVDELDAGRSQARCENAGGGEQSWPQALLSS